MQYVWVFFNPNGRLPRELYLVYGLPVVAALLGLKMYVFGQFVDDERPATLWLVPLFLLLWMQGCVMSRRLRDCGVSGALAIAIACILAADMTTTFFPDLLGETDEIRESSLAITGTIFLIFNWLFKLSCGACVVKQGDQGANDYGPALGTSDSANMARRENKRRMEREAEFPEYVVVPTQPLAAAPRAAAAPSRHAGVQRFQQKLQRPAGADQAYVAPAAPAAPTIARVRNGFGQR